ncbi:ABC transporter permease [Mesorhizobium sp. M1B.F.Ca.ET.045.04.1.1]|nr:ABC transporter permease [Mesorhizobium sp. M1B.F.Ca.ET.045.04.1.1]RWB18573.1 MAG: ABC transporter permease subunit [Mesorhizobium sp.]
MSEQPATKTSPARSASGPVAKQAVRHRRSSGIGAPIAKSSFLMIAVAVFAGLGLAWWAATGLGLVKPIFLPSPGSVAVQLGKLWSDGTLWLDLKASIYRISIGFLIASALAIPIGVLIGSFRAFEAAIEPLVDFIRYMPVVAFVPLSILWAGTGDVQKFLIIFIGTFFQQVLMIMDNVKRVPTDFVGLGRTLGLPDRKILTRIVVPSALPGIWDTLRISLGWAWTWLVLAELVAATSGLGYRITVSQRYFQTNTIIGYILLLGVLGLITDQVMKALGKVLFRQDSRS